MGSGSAMVISGLGAAVVTGAVAILSSYLTGRRAAAENSANRLEARSSREQALLSHIMPKQLDAIEAIWWHLYRAELHGRCSNEDVESIGRALVWVTEPVRDTCLRFLLAASESAQDSDAAFKEALVQARRALLELARVSRLDAVLTATMSRGDHDVD
jgi:hypothetical protein